MSSRPTVAFVTLGCARNEVDSEELAGRLAADGWDLVEEPGAADAVLVNTCGFVAAAKKDSVDTILSAADLKESGVLFQSVLDTGREQTFRDDRQVKLVVGNAGAVKLVVNGRDLGSPGGVGEVVRLTFGPGDPTLADG